MFPVIQSKAKLVNDPSAIVSFTVLRIAFTSTQLEQVLSQLTFAAAQNCLLITPVQVGPVNLVIDTTKVNFRGHGVVRHSKESFSAIDNCARLQSFLWIRLQTYTGGKVDAGLEFFWSCSRRLRRIPIISLRDLTVSFFVGCDKTTIEWWMNVWKSNGFTGSSWNCCSKEEATA